MYGNTCKQTEPMECAVCEPKRDTLAEKTNKISFLLNEAGGVLSDIGVNMFGDPPFVGERPKSECLEHDMNLNIIAMENLLGALKFLAERLY